MDSGPGPSTQGDIPDEPEGTPVFGPAAADEGGTPDALPERGFWDTLYGRRSIRKFTSEPVARDLVDRVLHAGIWAPSSCNYQMWDLVAVDDPEINAQLTELSLQMGNAPVNIVVSYGRDFSEENWANIQSASALIQNMSLAAHALGLGTFWITQMGDRERVRARVGLPEDRLVIAVLALGHPKVVPNSGPKRRPLSQVAHYNHYAGRPIPSSVNPEDWSPDLLAIYQRARVLNGLRHNKPRAWEVRALVEALEALLPDGKERHTTGEPPRWLDVLPCTGIVTEKLSRVRPGYRFDIVERTSEVAEFVAKRVKPKAGPFTWPDSGDLGSPPADTYDVVSCFYRVEDLTAVEREQLFTDLKRWVAPQGRILLGFVNRRSFHNLTEKLRKRRGGPGGVEYVLAPDPNIGPFEAISRADAEALAARAGLRVVEALSLHAAPQPEEIDFRSRNFSGKSKSLARGLGVLLGAMEKLPGLTSQLGRFQYLLLAKD